jgi:hypothetical protein
MIAEVTYHELAGDNPHDPDLSKHEAGKIGWRNRLKR